MSMRLLSPPQGKSRREKENETNELRSIQLDEVLRNKRKEINDLDKSLVFSLSEIGKRNYEEESKWKERITQLTEEVEQLELRKKRALVPLEEREKMLQDKDSALLKREEQVAIKESDLEYTRHLLTDKLDAISEREQDATDYAIKLNNREFAIQLQEQQISERMKALTTILQEAYDEMQKSQAEAAQQKAILKGREVPLVEREAKVEKAEKSFADRERAITDKYRTLLRAITETNLKYGSNQRPE